MSHKATARDVRLRIVGARRAEKTRTLFLTMRDVETSRCGTPIECLIRQWYVNTTDLVSRAESDSNGE